MESTTDRSVLRVEALIKGRPSGPETRQPASYDGTCDAEEPRYLAWMTIANSSAVGKTPSAEEVKLQFAGISVPKCFFELFEAPNSEREPEVDRRSKSG
jgi:hypothetical protein